VEGVIQISGAGIKRGSVVRIDRQETARRRRAPPRRLLNVSKHSGVIVFGARLLAGDENSATAQHTLDVSGLARRAICFLNDSVEYHQDHEASWNNLTKRST
jgi:hypothetical protein